VESVAAVSNVFRQDHSKRTICSYRINFSSFIPESRYLWHQIYVKYHDGNVFDSSTQTKYALISGIADSDAFVISKYTIQEFLLLGISIVSFERSSASPNSSCLIGFKCTNEDCLRIFSNRGMLLRHKQNRAHRGADCANMELAKKVYQINENRADNLQPARIVYRPLSGDVLHPAIALPAQYHAYQQYKAYKFSTRIKLLL